MDQNLSQMQQKPKDLAHLYNRLYLSFPSMSFTYTQDEKPGEYTVSGVNISQNTMARRGGNGAGEKEK